MRYPDQSAKIFANLIWRFTIEPPRIIHYLLLDQAWMRSGHRKTAIFCNRPSIVNPAFCHLLMCV